MTNVEIRMTKEARMPKSEAMHSFVIRASSLFRHSSFCIRHLALLLAVFLLITSPARSHPLQAEPINHAYVFNFDQFYLDQDPDEHVVNGGFLLLAELNCTACHVAPESWQERLKAKPGPNLGGVGSRLDADTLWLMIRSPQHRKKGTQMPGLFAGEAGDDEKVEALVEYLSANKWDAPQMPAGDVERGKELYHKVGCVACHEPALDARPPKVPADAEVEKPGNGSVPIALADAYRCERASALSACIRFPCARLAACRTCVLSTRAGGGHRGVSACGPCRGEGDGACGPQDSEAG
jgi:mono/diheme cytochrome c family protein